MRGKSVIISDDTKQEIITLYEDGYSILKLAEMFGINDMTLTRRLKEWGVVIDKNRRGDKSIPFTDTEKLDIIGLFDKHSVHEIADAYKVSSGVIHRRLIEWGVDTSRKIKFTEDEILDITTSYINGESSESLANRYDVSYDTIQKRLVEWGVELRTVRLVEFTDEEQTHIINLYSVEGLNTYEIADMYNTSPATIRKRLNSWGIETSRFTYSCNDNFFSNLDSPKPNYWLGFITSDGSMSDSDCLDISLNAIDKDHLQKFLDDIESDHRIYVYDYSKGVGQVAEIRIQSKRIATDLGKYGIYPRKTYVAKPYGGISTQFERDYWRGQIDGDGSIGCARFSRGRIYPYISISGTEDICTGFMNYCRKFVDSSAKVFHRTDSPACVYKLSGKAAVIMIRSLYEGADIYLDRKYKRAMEILAQYG